jgi:hypothetical protein
MANRLFKPSKIWYHNAVAGGAYSAPYAYILGYYSAAENLAQIAIENRELDTLFFPICFNYRHYMELSLKHLILNFEQFAVVLEELGYKGKTTESVADKAKKEHGLGKLLNWLVVRFEKVTDEKLDNDLQELILEFHNIDPNGQIFRYPTLKGNSFSLPYQKLYDVENIRHKMQEINIHFSGMDSWLRCVFLSIVGIRRIWKSLKDIWRCWQIF